MLLWSLVVPVKRLAVAKTRLASLAGVARSDLALAFAEDTVSAALACPAVSAVVVVSDEAEAARRLTAIGATVVPDEPNAGLNRALSYGVRIAAEKHAGSGVGALSADLPALRPAELARALEAAAAHQCAFVADAGGAGTVLLAAINEGDFQPRFGLDSARLHRAAGAVEVKLPQLSSLRTDVDTPEDLARALALGVGTRTAAVVAMLPAAARERL